MEYSIQKAVFINRAEAINNVRADRVYFGNEFCENLIPQYGRLKQCYALAKLKDKQFTFVSPFVTNYGLRKLECLFEFLDKQGAVEVVFNDWGVFDLLNRRFRNIVPVLGRLLTKQRRDPRLQKILLGRQQIVNRAKGTKTVFVPKKIPVTLFEHYRGSVINVPIFQKQLLSWGIKRIEIDNLIWGMNISVDKRIGVSVYLPYGYITTGRACGKISLTYAACRKECQRYYIRLEDKDLAVPLLSIGNTVFYKSPPPSLEELKKCGIDRIVFQRRLPF
jgi:hypothetical protein